MHSAAPCILLALATSALAMPTDIKYGPPPGGWDSIDYPAGTGENLPNYPDGTGEDLPYYAPGTGASTTSPGTTCPICPAAGAATNAPPSMPMPMTFTSTYHITATPGQVINGTTPTGGLPGTSATYDLAINSADDIICWDIQLHGFRGDFDSPAATATHVHEAARGATGPPRLAFPNPVPVGDGSGAERRSVGCMMGPFVTGLTVNGTDTGAAFRLREIEEDPAGFFADVHSSLAVPGAVRGQFA